MKVLEELGYLDSPKFIQPSKLDSLPPSELVFALRKFRDWEKKDSGTDPDIEDTFRGAYVLQQKKKESAVPVVYTFQAKSEDEAKHIHKLVWNQNLAPFVIIESPSMIRIYPGFSYDRVKDNSLKSIPKNAANYIQELSAFRSDAIDDGSLWQQWGDKVDPTKRVDERLLKDLKQLDRYLQDIQLPRATSHGIIGKYVYLHYLRARDILSDRKLESWHLNEADIFSRNATIKAFKKLNTELQDWLNGSVFSLGEESLSNLSQEQLRLVAGVFKGDSISQLTLDFRIYDFSYIPIETLSCVYEQFLHDTAEKDGKSRGEKLSAYYTPIPLTDYIISELETRRPLKEGMKILDPSCGSGSFLVQCYRRLIEKKYRTRTQKNKLTPPELRKLLVNHIFGIDKDQDACRVTELSLILTLLDYVNPPDLENTTFKLPKLCGKNIFESDFFDPNSNWQQTMHKTQFDWIVGNPPWDEVTGKPSDKEHEHFYVWKWIEENKLSFPTGGNQTAECFLWKVGQHSNKKTVIGLLVPAMTWFKKESISFRQHFFSERRVWCLSNFSNMAFVLFGGRITPRASAVFFECILPQSDNTILTFSPFVVEQIANRLPKKKLPTWNIVVNESEIKEVFNEEAASGEMLPWKLAMWASNRDKKLLQRIRDKFIDLQKFAKDVKISQPREGVQLREQTDFNKKVIEEHLELVGSTKVIFKKLKSVGIVFSLPPYAISKINKSEAYIRKRGGLAGLEVSIPPHLLIDAARRFAIFSDDFILVPPRQIGIRGSDQQAKLLRALSLYLSSDFCKYHQFLSSPQFGIMYDIADLETLKQLPIPLKLLSDEELKEWENIQRSLSLLSQQKFSGMGWQLGDKETFESLLATMNSKVFDLLQLRSSERILVQDFVHLHFELMSGKISTELTRQPKPAEMKEYFTTLRSALDDFISEDQNIHHKIEAIHDDKSAMFSVSIVTERQPIPVNILDGDNNDINSLKVIRESLRRRHSQWIYFNRGLKVYEKGTLYQFKPMQRLHWSRRQAILDADEIISETLNVEEPS
jgi:hypothetical protein